MNNDLSHFATCQVWQTGNWQNCDCKGQAPWKVRKEPEELFPWRIWRYTEDGTYEHLMRASTWQAAMELVDGLNGMRRQALRQSMSERSSLWVQYRLSLGDRDV